MAVREPAHVCSHPVFLTSVPTKIEKKMRNAKKKKKLQECESNISWKDTAPCLKGFDVEYQVWWFLKDGPITEDGWRMCWSQLPLLVGDGSHLIYLQLPGDSVSIRAG